MALYTLKSRDEALLPLANYNGDNTWIRNQMSSLGYTPTPAQTQVYSALGRTTGAEGNGGSNFFEKRAKSIENALGTTGAAIASFAKDRVENDNTENLLRESKNSMNDIAKKYGYNSWSDWQDANAAARESGDTEAIKRFDEQLKEFQAQANANAAKANKKAADYEDYRKNDYISNKINQDQGKFAGSAINTLSTAVDVTGLGANPLSNAIQGGVEGLADELEQNGFENFDWQRAGQNALIGATTGAVTGALNKGISNSLAKNGGNLFKGGNFATRGLNNLGSKTALGRVGSTLATGAARGAVSGAVGGATGAGLQSALNGVEFGQGVQNALQGAVQGAQQGAVTGGIMAGANAALGKTNFGKQLQNAKTNWDQSGSNFDERLTNTLTSGDSAVGDWLMNKRQSNILGAAGNLGNRVQDVSDLQARLTDIRQRAEKLDANRDDYGMPDESWRSDAYVYEELLNNPQTRRVIDSLELTDNPTAAQAAAITQYLRDNGYLDTPTTASLARGAGYNNEAEAWEEYAKYKNNLAAKEYQNRLNSYNAAVEAKNGDFSYNDKTGRIIDADNRYIPPKYSAEELNEWLLNNQQAQTPTTAKGWAKQAGKRIVEDINNSNLGNRIKDISSDMPEDIRNMQINRNDMLGYADDNTTPLTVEEVLAREGIEPNSAPRPQATAPAALDPWDRVAQEAGYSNYDEVLQRYAEANPNVKINPRGMAGQVLTWMDQNPNTPTTAAGWAKRAGQRAVEDINNSNLGLKVQDVSQDDPSKQLYNALAGNGQPVAETEAGTETTVVPSKTSAENKWRYAKGKELLTQYGTVDAPMARATKAVETFQKLSDMGFEKPADVESISNAITGANGYASTLNKSIIKSAKPVDTFAGDNGQTIDDFVDNSIEHNMLSGTNQGVAVKRSINAYLRSLPSRAEGSVDYTDSASDTFKVVQGLEARAAELEGRGGSTYHRATTEDLHQAAVLKDVASLLKDRIYDGADAKVAITPKVVKDMKALAPGNEKWAATVDDFAKNVKTPQDIRSFQEPFVKAGRYIDNQYVQAATVGGRMAANAGELPDTLRTTKAGIINDIANRVWNSSMAHRGRAALYGKLADRAAEKATDNPTTAKGWAKQAGQRAAEDLGNTNLGNRIQDVNGQPVNQQVATPAELANTVADYNPSTQLYNAIGRTEGALAQETPAQYLANAAQEAEIVAPSTGANMQAASTGGTSTSMYNALTGTPTAVQQTNTGSINTGYYQPTGDYWTDIIASAMSAAIDADDVNAFATLYGMYQDQLANLQKQASAAQSSSQQKLTATQQRANAAMNSLERLSGMEPDTAYNLSGIPIIGNIATFGGNDYEAEAKSLAQQIGYMVSGSNIKDSEAENIGKAYVPQPWDNEQVRQNKLRRAYEIIQRYQNGYTED